MPDNIYGINVGQVETPSGGTGVRGGGLQPANNSINSLLRFQQKMTELEAQKRQKALDNTNLLFQGAVKNRGFGAEDNKKFLGFSPNNKFEAGIISQTQAAVDDQLSQFAKSDGSNESYANMSANINKILSNEDFIAAGATNTRVNNVIKDIQDRKLDLHPLWYSKLQQYQNAEDSGSYELADILNPTKFERTKVTPKDDYDDFSKLGITLRSMTDPATGTQYIVTDQNNHDLIKRYTQEKYGKNFGLDFDYLKFNKDEVYHNYMTKYGDEDLAKEAYIANQANSMANNYAVNAEGTSFQQNLGDTITEQIRQADRELKDKQTLETQRHENRMTEQEQKHEDQMEYSTNVGTLAKQREQERAKIVQALGEAWKNKNPTEIQQKVDKIRNKTGRPELTKEQVAEAIQNVNTVGKSESEIDDLVAEEAGKILISNDSNYTSNVKNEIADKIKSNKDVTYTVLGDSEKHDLTKERYSDESLTNKIGDMQSGRASTKADQTVVRDITDVYQKGGKTIARGTIITKNTDRSGRLPSGKSARDLSPEEIDKLNKEGYNLDKTKKYIEVPVDIEIDRRIIEPTSRAGVIGFLENDGRRVGSNPTTSAKSTYQFLDETGYNLAKRVYPSITKEEYLRRINSDKEEDKDFANELFAASEPDMDRYHAMIKKDIETDSAFNKKLIDYIVTGVRNAKNGIKDFTLDSVPNWMIDYMIHHNGNYKNFMDHVKGTNKDDLAGMFSVIAKGIRKYGTSDIDYNQANNDTPADQSLPPITPPSDTIKTQQQPIQQAAPQVSPTEGQKSTKRKRLGDL